jgi:putative methionine-R-sulfoxide reductase with GAF domain
MMDVDAYEKLYREKEEALKKQIREQEWKLRDAQAVYAYELDKLRKLQYRGLYLYKEVEEELSHAHI